MSRVAVVGGGTMGNGIAQVFATKGHEVVLLEVNAVRIDKAKQAIQGSLERIAKKGGLTPEDAQSALDRVTGTTRAADLAGAALAVEAVVEDFEIKRDVFLSLDSVLPPESVLAGQLVCEVGVAVAAPAEFLVFRIGRREGVVEVTETP